MMYGWGEDSLSCPSYALHKAEGELELMKQALQCAIFESERRERTIKGLLNVMPPRPVYECPICFDGYETEGGEQVPRVLKCGHTACELCIVERHAWYWMPGISL
ncbi:hypothetical protein CAEBREN_19997 [Caenorhabditis brenneri]|uniref:Zinc finger RING-type eukaryotic domain-containing protein n=1 Tax=Caenorhabditis brenneri TaxID=135651 RepID=G0MD02_CAEBE|nr:hypothetical protein CAEBREN_19997 [Caenorhabditis brenneri]